jgi:3-hydroxybutyryl-CoA dehydrogenase
VKIRVAKCNKDFWMKANIADISVCGGGVMGVGIAQFLAQRGFVVPIVDANRDQLQRNLDKARGNLARLVDRGKLEAEEAEAALRRIRPVDRLEDIAQVDLVIEAVFEDLELKREVFRTLDDACPPHTILATNTSILPPTAIGAATRRPQKTVGMHWMNPAPVMKLIEVTRGYETSDETFDAIVEFCRSVGKVPVRVNEALGGIVSRILTSMRNTAVDLLAEGVASVEDIDTAMKLGAGFPMGPFELLDFVGIDLHTSIADAYTKEFGDLKYRPNALLRKMVRAGHHGRKTGRGFYTYPTEAPGA